MVHLSSEPAIFHRNDGEKERQGPEMAIKILFAEDLEYRSSSLLRCSAEESQPPGGGI